MKLRQKQQYLGFFATTLLVALTSQTSLAFTIKPTQPGANNTYDASEPYRLTTPAGAGEVKLVPASISNDLKLGGTDGFLTQLKKEFTEAAGWKFLTGNDLKGRFEIDDYYACAPTTECTNNFPGADPKTRKDGVGASIDLRYIPGEGDPTPKDNVLHWIQQVVYNFPTDTNKIDIVSGQTNPFYDTNFTANEERFADQPYRGGSVSAKENISFAAELYLVEIKDSTKPKEITIYNGIKWGWTNEFKVPEPLTLIASGLAIGFGALCQREYSKKRQQK